MSKKDTASKLFFSQKEVVAELINTFIYKGKRKVNKDSLRAMPTDQLRMTRGKDGQLRTDNYFMDLLYQYEKVTDGKLGYYLLGIEEQSSIAKDMVFRNLIYQANEYARQRKQYKETGEPILPMATLVVNFSPRRWTAPRSIREWFGDIDEEFKEFIQEGKIHIIEPKDIPEKFFRMPYTNLKYVLHCCKFSDDKKKLKRILKTEVPEGNISTETADLLECILNIRLRRPEEKEDREVNMCEAMKQILADEREKGLQKGLRRGQRIAWKGGWKEGKKEGEEKGRKEGEEKGRKEGEEKGRKEGEEKGRKEGEEKGRKEGEERGIEKGRKEGEDKATKRMVLQAAKCGISISTISAMTSLPRKKIMSIVREASV